MRTLSLPGPVGRRLARRRRARLGGRWPYEISPIEPPAVPAGSVVAPPDFIGVGAQKAGTSWWHGLIADHPNVDQPPTRPKELHFFDRFWDAELFSDDVAAYHQWFARPPGFASGEWTPRYLFDVWVPPLLTVAAPGARLLVLLRDPVERYRSSIARDLDRGAPRTALVAQDAYHRGLYGLQLEHLFEHVDRERVLVLQYERCRDDPEQELTRTYEFLGLDPGHRPDDLRRHVGPRLEKLPLPPWVADALRAAYAADARRLAVLVPDLDLDRWSTAATH